MKSYYLMLSAFLLVNLFVSSIYAQEYPTAITVVVDDSRSMNDFDQSHQRIQMLQKFMDNVGKETYLGLISFKENVDIIFPLLPVKDIKRDLWMERVGKLTGSGQKSNLINALIETKALLSESKFSNYLKIIVLISDGYIDIQGISENEAQNKLKKDVIPELSNKKIFIFALALSRHNIELIDYFTTKTNGKTIMVDRPENFSERIKTLYAEFNQIIAESKKSRCKNYCMGRKCGDDGCGGTCAPGCDNNSLCRDGQCICQPQCKDHDCGSDGCGQTCGECKEGFNCESERCVKKNNIVLLISVIIACIIVGVISLLLLTNYIKKQKQSSGTAFKEKTKILEKPKVGDKDIKVSPSGEITKGPPKEITERPPVEPTNWYLKWDNKIFHLFEKEYSLGRDPYPKNDIVEIKEWISRIHAKLKVFKNKVVIIDHGSSHGVFLKRKSSEEYEKIPSNEEIKIENYDSFSMGSMSYSTWYVLINDQDKTKILGEKDPEKTEVIERKEDNINLSEEKNRLLKQKEEPKIKKDLYEDEQTQTRDDIDKE